MSKIQLNVDVKGRETIIANFIRGMAITEPSYRPIAVLSELPIDPVSASDSIVESTSDLIHNLQKINYFMLDFDKAELSYTVGDVPLLLFEIKGDTTLDFSDKMLEPTKGELCHLLRPTSIHVLLALKSGVSDTDTNKALVEQFIARCDVPRNYVAFSSNHNEIKSFKYTTRDNEITLDVEPYTEYVDSLVSELEQADIVSKVS